MNFSFNFLGGQNTIEYTKMPFLENQFGQKVHAPQTNEGFRTTVC